MIAFSRQKTASLRLAAIALLGSGILSAHLSAQPAPAKPATPPPPADVLVLANGDTLHGKFVQETGGNVVFNSEMVGTVTVPWAKIKELHSSQKFAIIPKGVQLQGKKKATEVVTGTVSVEDNKLTVANANVPPIPVANAAYIVDAATVDKLLHHEPSFFQSWNGAATAGATIISASTKQYTYTAGIGLVRTVPNVAWLTTRNRTAFNLTASYGEITQPSYVIPASPGPPPVPATPVAASTLKSGIIHFDGERDEYISPRVFVLGMMALDHNYSLDLHLQQIYGGGFGYTVVKTPKQELDLKGTAQYEKQDFTGTPATSTTPATPNTINNLIGSTFAGSYQLHSKFLTYTQGVNFIPAWNQTSDWSFNEVNSVAFPAYKNLSFSIGTLDTYLNNPPVTEPPTVNNSFQFTFGLTYAIKSKY
jgi:hypothetical protein